MSLVGRGVVVTTAPVGQEGRELAGQIMAKLTSAYPRGHIIVDDPPIAQAFVVIEAVGAEADGAFFQHVTSAKLKLQGGSPVALNWCIDSVRKGATSASSGRSGRCSAR